MEILPLDIITLILTKLSPDTPEFDYLRSLYDVKYEGLASIKYKYMTLKIREINIKYPDMISVDYEDLYQQINAWIQKVPFRERRNIVTYLSNGSPPVFHDIPDIMEDEFTDLKVIYIFCLYSLWPHSLEKIKYFPDYVHLPELLYKLHHHVHNSKTTQIFDYMMGDNFEGVITINQEIVFVMYVAEYDILLLYLLIFDTKLRDRVTFTKSINLEGKIKPTGCHKEYMFKLLHLINNKILAGRKI